MKITIGSRGSKLALWQAHFTRDRLEAAGFDVEITTIKTKGDQIQHLGFDKIEGKGFFTKEIEDALLAGEVDLAVHSCKDMPTESPEGLSITAYSQRAAPNDVLLIRADKTDNKNFLQLPEQALVGTSSARRKAQLLSLRPDIRIKDIRGNVPTRIKKLRDGEFDAILLAAAGLNRLEVELEDLMKDIVRLNLSPSMFIPAPAQGVLAYQVRKDDDRMAEALAVLNDNDAMAIAEHERSILAAFQGGCQVPIGIYSTVKDDGMHTWISRAGSWDAIPQRMYLGPDDNTGTASILAAFESTPKASVFISTRLTEDDIFKRHLESMNVVLNDQPLIDFKAVEFEADLDVDWLFFSSKNAAKYFFEHMPEIPADIRIAAINKGTARALARMGRPADFVGEGGSMAVIAAAFDQVDGNSVLFPRASHSRRTIQQLLVNKAVTDVVVYENFPVQSAEARAEEVLVFTSPMNVESYFAGNTITSEQAAVAIGSSTAKALKAHKVDCAVAYEPTRWALVDTVTRLLCLRDRKI